MRWIESLVQQRDDKDYFLRVYVDAGGCSGFQYQFEVDKEIDEDEDFILVEDADSKFPRVVVDETSLGFTHHLSPIVRRFLGRNLRTRRRANGLRGIPTRPAR